MGSNLDWLGSERLSWVDLAAFIKFSPRDSAVARSLLGDDTAMWGVSEHLLAAVVDLLSGANWQRGGGKGQKPRPVRRPGVRGTTIGSGAIPMSEFNAWWDSH